MAGLQTGELSVVIGAVPPDQISIVQQMDNVQLTMTEGYMNDMMFFNNQRPPFDNVKVRQALNYAIDKAQVTKALLGDAATVARAVPLGPRIWVFEKAKWQAAYEKMPTYEYDLAKARQLLAESGVADQLNGKEILTTENPTSLGQALALQAAATELGITLNVRKVTFAELPDILFNGAHDYDILTISWSPDFPDPSATLLPVFHSRNRGPGGSNWGNYQNAEVDRLLDEQNDLTDDTQRTDLMIQIQQIVAGDAAIIVFDHPKQPLAMNKQFTGYTITPLWYHDAFAKNIRKR